MGLASATCFIHGWALLGIQALCQPAQPSPDRELVNRVWDLYSLIEKPGTPRARAKLNSKTIATDQILIAPLRRVRNSTSF